jgi:hypothetical protein
MVAVKMMSVLIVSPAPLLPVQGMVSCALPVSVAPAASVPTG